MKQKKFVFVLMITIIMLFNNCTQKPNLQILAGKYLGQKPPWMKAQLFAPGVLSTDANEFNAAFTLSGDAVYFSSSGPDGQDIMVIELKNGIWNKRKPASFSDSYRDVDPFITPDGEKLFFSSNRPITGNEAEEDCDFWYVEKLKSGGWSKAKHLDNPSTKGKHDFYYVSTLDGDIYYSIFNDGKGDLYFISGAADNKSPIKLDYPISTEHNEHDPFVPPDESYLIFSSDRPAGQGSNDLYICFNEDGKWTKPINMGEEINSKSYDYCPILSPDGKYLFFSSSRSGNGDVYWVDVEVINELREEYIN